MKQTKRILSIVLILILMLMFCSKVVKGDSYSQENIFSGVTISNGEKVGDKVIFNINLPSQTGRRGDVTGDGTVDAADSTLLLKYCAEKITIDEIDAINSDFNADRTINVADVVAINMALIGSTNIEDEKLEEAKEVGYYPDRDELDMNAIAVKTPVVLNGTLASQSTAILKKDDNGNFSVEVTIPEGTTSGTIGITLVQGAFINNEAKFNGFVTSNLCEISDKYEKFFATVTPAENKVTISPGEKNDNKVTFKINLEDETELRGDVNSDGKVDASDVELLQKWIVKEVTEGISGIASDVNGDGVVNTFDNALLRRLVQSNNSIELFGDLKDKASYELKKDANGDYIIEVTIPDDITEGTIGVTLAEGVFINANHVKSTEVSSEQFNYSNTENPKSDETGELKVIDQKNEKQDDGKIKVTLTVNKELDKDKIPDGWTLSEDGKSISKVMNKDEKEELELVAKDGSKLTYTVVASADSSGSDTDGKDEDKTTADSKIPYAGAYGTIAVAIIGIVLVAIITFSKLRKIKK